MPQPSARPTLGVVGRRSPLAVWSVTGDPDRALRPCSGPCPAVRAGHGASAEAAARVAPVAAADSAIADSRALADGRALAGRSLADVRALAVAARPAVRPGACRRVVRRPG